MKQYITYRLQRHTFNRNNKEIVIIFEEAVYPFRCSGNNLEEIIDKAFSFFDNNFGKYKFIKY